MPGAINGSRALPSVKITDAALSPRARRSRIDSVLGNVNCGSPATAICGARNVWRPVWNGTAYQKSLKSLQRARRFTSLPPSQCRDGRVERRRGFARQRWRQLLERLELAQRAVGVRRGYQRASVPEARGHIAGSLRQRVSPSRRAPARGLLPSRVCTRDRPGRSRPWSLERAVEHQRSPPASRRPFVCISVANSNCASTSAVSSFAAWRNCSSASVDRFIRT